MGGAQSVAEAIFAGLPVLMFESADTHTVSEWTMPEIWGIEETIIPRWYYDKWLDMAVRLATDDAFRYDIGRKAIDRAEQIGDYENYVRQRERIYVDTFSKAVSAGEGVGTSM